MNGKVVAGAGVVVGAILTKVGEIVVNKDKRQKTWKNTRSAAGSVKSAGKKIFSRKKKSKAETGWDHTQCSKEEILNHTIADLPISDRKKKKAIVNILKDYNMNTIGDLCQLPEEDIRKIHGIAGDRMEAIAEAVGTLGSEFHFAMEYK